MTNKSFSKPPVKPKRSPQHRQNSMIIAIVAIILAIIAIIFGVINRQQNSALNDRYANQSGVLQQQLTDKLQAQQQNMSQLEKTLKRMRANLNELNSSLYNSPELQALSEAGYLIRLANLQLQYNNNVKAGIWLLTSAEERLNNFTSKRTAAIKAALKNDLARLSDIQPVAKARILQRIDQLSRKIDGLPTVPRLSASQSHTTADSASVVADTKQGWWSRFKHSMGELKSLIVVRRVNNAALQLYTPEQLLLVKQNIQLKLAEAQWAVIHDQVVIYHQSLNLADKWLQRYTASNQQVSQSIMNELNALKNLSINAPIKQPLQSLRAIHLQSQSKPKAAEQLAP